MATTRGQALLAWYRAEQRALPWREIRDPYRILVSEVMLQQTQVSRVVPAYERFLVRFPTVESLAAAPLEEVLEAWSGLGYPMRARRLRECARLIAADGWPTTAESLQTLPGVGPYTAAAVASIAFDESVAAVDTNVRRVLSRWHGTPLAGTALEDAAQDALTGAAREWNQAMMDLGATVCRPRDPSCEACPVARWCADPSVYQSPPRQGRYPGSNRQLRGDLLRLLDRRWRRPEALAESVEQPVARIAAVIEGLGADGLVEIGPRGARIAP